VSAEGVFSSTANKRHIGGGSGSRGPGGGRGGGTLVASLSEGDRLL
jgi:hypothetical protein